MGNLKEIQLYLICSWLNSVEVPFISSFIQYPTTAERNDFTGSMGFRFQVTQAITVSKIGRLYVVGNTQDHKANLWVSTDQVTPIASGTILAASVADANGFKWVDITPVVIGPGNTYAVAINETAGGDTWKDTWVCTGFIDPVYFTSVVEGFRAGADQYPSVGAAANKMYDTAALWHSA